jgi:GMP synthase - Glutamine amidotransferase domain
MDRPRVALVNASYDDTNTRRNFRRELDASVEEFDATEGHLPVELEHDAVVVTGSRASVYWDEPWIDATRDVVRRALDRDLPVLGVCWGHQLLADAVGGTVEAMADREIGYREITLTTAGREDPLFAGVDSPLLAFTTHGDSVVALPDDATRLAENDYGLQAFRHGTGVGVHFHPEYYRQTAREVTRGKDLPQERERQVLDGVTDENYRRASRAKTLFANFTDGIATRAAD